MATGSVVGFQGCVPQYGESTITQATAATDLLTLKLAASGTGDFLVFQNSAGSELGSITSSGVLIISTLSGIGAQTVGSTLTVTGACSLNSDVTVASGLNVTKLTSLASQLTVTSSAIISALLSAKSGLTVTSSAVFSSLLSAAGQASFAQSASFASSVGFNGATPIGKSAVGNACDLVSGAFGWGSSASFLQAATMLNSIRAALVSVGLVTA